ncbi:MAG: hypothetical protein JWM10_1446 [Myxococcaceae bacterium]|nr:hypothetical protein [Myxococcaceae bacterium]
MIRMLAYKGIPTVCPIHGGGVIESPDRGVLVGGEGLHAAASGDVCNCPGAPNTILAGATDILVKGLPASGWLHVTAHNPGPPDAPTASVIWGSTGVLMGGGMTVGPVGPATAACMMMADGRNGKGWKGDKTKQSGQNCGVESMRQIINAKRARDGDKRGPMKEDELLDETLRAGDSYVTVTDGDRADVTLIETDDKLRPYREKRDAALAANQKEHGKDRELSDKANAAQKEYDQACERIIPKAAGYGTPIAEGDQLHAIAEQSRARQRARAEAAAKTDDFKDPGRAQAGGTLSGQQQRVLDRHGIATEEYSQDKNDPEKMKALEDAVCRGHGVIIGVNAGPLWGDGTEGGHAVLVTAVEYGEDGKVTGYVTNDTVKGCGTRVPVDRLRGALQPQLKATVTKDPIW